MRVTWPFLGYIFCLCMKKRKRTFQQGLKRAIKRKLGLKQSKSEEQVENNPFLLLGYGMNAYFDVVMQLFCMMLFITIFAIPLMSRYASFTGLKG